jgi:hypothetical protein
LLAQDGALPLPPDRPRAEEGGRSGSAGATAPASAAAAAAAPAAGAAFAPPLPLLQNSESKGSKLLLLLPPSAAPPASPVALAPLFSVSLVSAPVASAVLGRAKKLRVDAGRRPPLPSPMKLALPLLLLLTPPAVGQAPLRAASAANGIGFDAAKSAAIDLQSNRNWHTRKRASSHQSATLMSCESFARVNLHLSR